MSLTFPTNADDLYSSVTPEAIVRDMAVSITGAYAAIQATLASWKGLKRGPKIFIVTGSILPHTPVPVGFTLGAGKSTLMHLVNCGAMVYGGKGNRFYYATQVTNLGRMLSNDEVVGEAYTW
jgi:hypothetical protein